MSESEKAEIRSGQYGVVHVSVPAKVFHDLDEMHVATKQILGAWAAVVVIRDSISGFGRRSSSTEPRRQDRRIDR